MTQKLHDQQMASMEREFTVKMKMAQELKTLEIQLARMDAKAEAAKEAKEAQAMHTIIPYVPISAILPSTILQPHQQQQLLAVLPPGNWVLAYRASTNGQAGANFHGCCDNRGPSVSVIRSGSNIFG